MKIHELHYSNTNTYLIEGSKGKLLFDTGWAGTFPLFCKAMGELKIPVQKIDLLLISHFHSDHMGIVQQIADLGSVILIPEVQRKRIHDCDSIFSKEKGNVFLPIKDESVRYCTIDESRDILKEIGIDGNIIHTPGHSDDSVSLWLDDGSLFVGDLNPLYELKLHTGTQIGDSWERLLKLEPKTVYYGHAKKSELESSTVIKKIEPESGAVTKKTESESGTATKKTESESGTATKKTELESGTATKKTESESGTVIKKIKVEDIQLAQKYDNGVYATVERIMRFIDKGYDLNKIRKKTGVDERFIEDVMRMYLTHQNIGVQGILDRIEIKGM